MTVWIVAGGGAPEAPPQRRPEPNTLDRVSNTSDPVRLIADRYVAEYSATIPVVAHAGAGIVAQSNPDKELLETRVKFRPIVDALA